jgi:hypothetical protein
MAFKLDKQEKERRDQIVADIYESAGKLEDAIAVYNDEMTKLRGPLDEAIRNYNEVVESARGFAEDIASAADCAIDDKSEKWQDSDNGQAAVLWKDEWESASFDEIEVEYPDDLTIDGIDHAATLDQLPEEAS